VLDVVPEDPQEEHVPAQMSPPAVEKHRRQQRGPVRKWDERRQIGAGRELPRDDVDDLVVLRDLDTPRGILPMRDVLPNAFGPADLPRL